MKKSSKRIIAFILFLVIIFLSSNNVFATLSGTFNGKIDTGASDGTTKIKTIISAALYIVRVVGSGLAFIILMVLGCKYMIASAGEKAEIKKHAIAYVVGAVVLVAASGIIGIIQKFVFDVL